MTHAHHSDVEIVEGERTGVASGLLLMIAALLIVMVIAFAVLWSRPWDSSPRTNDNNVPAITDNSGQPGDQSGGGTGDSGSQPQQPAP